MQSARCRHHAWMQPWPASPPGLHSSTMPSVRGWYTPGGSAWCLNAGLVSSRPPCDLGGNLWAVIEVGGEWTLCIVGVVIYSCLFGDRYCRWNWSYCEEIRKGYGICFHVLKRLNGILYTSLTMLTLYGQPTQFISNEVIHNMLHVKRSPNDLSPIGWIQCIWFSIVNV